MGKDVVSFLSWAAEPEMEERKLVSLSFSSPVHIAFCLMWQTYSLNRAFLVMTKRGLTNCCSCTKYALLI